MRLYLDVEQERRLRHHAVDRGVRFATLVTEIVSAYADAISRQQVSSDVQLGTTNSGISS